MVVLESCWDEEDEDEDGDEEEEEDGEVYWVSIVRLMLGCKGLLLCL